MAPNEVCPECGAMGHREVYLEASSFRCPVCGYREPPKVRPKTPTQRDVEVEEAVLYSTGPREDE